MTTYSKMTNCNKSTRSTVSNLTFTSNASASRKPLDFFRQDRVVPESPGFDELLVKCGHPKQKTHLKDAESMGIIHYNPGC